MSRHSVSSDNPIHINTLFDELLDLGIKFVVSPHAFKQRKRAIDWEWHVDGGPAPNVHKYMDQFFAFWETSGASQIARAIEYLEMMDCGKMESIVSFSDSKDFEKLKSYLDNPPQYFAALPNFIGLQMVGSEVSRITRTPIAIHEDERGQYLGSVTIGDQKIDLSPRLNTIIGGRGSGKSVLLDRLAMALDDSKCEKHFNDTDRIEFLKASTPTVQCLSGQTVIPDSFQFEYFNQSYVSLLFQSKGDAFNRQLEGYFGSAFDLVNDIDTESVKSSNSVRLMNSYRASPLRRWTISLTSWVGSESIMTRNCL